ncbi:ABC transporter ATP-binding protein [Thermotomaculum hydrothermale]|nr:ABC transporter ATP-binding protein [Thermotomaculum hydrothermale]
MGETELRAVDGISLNIKEGEFLGIMGASGSGKSTLMNIIGILDSPTEGKYFLKGKDVSFLDDIQASKIRNKEIGFVFQTFNLIKGLTAFENVETPLIYAGIPKKRRKEIVEYYLDKMGIADRMKHKPNQLSGGQRQRVAIARALVNEPSIILADEPTGNLDSKTTEEILNLFHKIHEEGKTIVLVTHETEIGKETERTIVLKDGKIIKEYKN